MCLCFCVAFMNPLNTLLSSPFAFPAAVQKMYLIRLITTQHCVCKREAVEDSSLYAKTYLLLSYHIKTNKPSKPYNNSNSPKSIAVTIRQTISGKIQCCILRSGNTMRSSHWTCSHPSWAVLLPVLKRCEGYVIVLPEDEQIDLQCLWTPQRAICAYFI